MTIEEIKAANAAAGQHFFEPATLHFFRSRVSSRVHAGPGGIFIVTSEQYVSRHGSHPRKYTVREFLPTTSTFRTVGEFQQYRSGVSAHNAAAFHAAGQQV